MDHDIVRALLLGGFFVWLVLFGFGFLGFFVEQKVKELFQVVYY